MAEKRQTTTYESILSDLSEGKFAPLYILMGEESYFIDKITDFIAQNALREEERDFNQTVCFGSDVSAAAVADMARRYPMMAERQVVIVKEAQNIKQWDQLEQYFEKPQPTTVLVIAYKNGTIDGRKKILTKAQNAGAVIFESKKLYERDLPVFMVDYLKRHQATIDHKSCQMIAEHIGSDLSRLTSELDKVCLSMPEDSRHITPEVVEEQIGVSKDFNGFEFRSAIANRDILKANQILKYFDSNPKSGGPFMLIPLLFNFFQNLMLAHYAPQKTDSGVAQFLDLRSAWGAKEYMTGLRNYSGMKTMQIIQKIRETDAKSKGLDNPNTPVGDLMKELVFFILH
jgi:DNA polymerase-3 subunit delta